MIFRAADAEGITGLPSSFSREDGWDSKATLPRKSSANGTNDRDSGDERPSEAARA